MPELPRINKPDESSRIGQGEFKSAYKTDKRNIVEKRYDRPNAKDYLEKRDILSPSFLKGEFYLGKIMQMLYPDNVAEIHMASAEGEEGHTINEYVPHSLQKEEFAQMDPISRKLFTLVQIDGGPKNYRKDDQGNIKFIDSFEPWDRQKDGALYKLYNEEEIKKVIEEELEEPKKSQALKYLERVNNLFDNLSKKDS